MAHLNQQEAFEDFKTRALEGIKSHFPVEGRDRRLELEDIDVQGAEDVFDDIEAQHAAKVNGETFSRPIIAKVSIVDKTTGKKTTQNLRVGDLPIITRRHSYIVAGQEYQADSQWQLKPGAYTRRAQTGELVTKFNIANRPPFDIAFDPKDQVFRVKRGKSEKIAAYPIIKAMGVSDDELEKRWGKDVLSANKTAAGVGGALDKFYKADRKSAPESKEVAESYVRRVLLDSELRPDATEVTLGKGFKNVEGDTLVRATGKLLDVQRGAPEDDRDSLVFKDLRGVGDYAYDMLTDWRNAKSIQAKLQRQLNSPKTSLPRDVVRADVFAKPLRGTFSTSAVRVADQVNPVEMMASTMQTTVMGQGGIRSEHEINSSPEMKYINQSHFGFLDPLHTPEGSRTGVTLHLPMGAKKVGKEVKIPVYDIAKGERTLIGPKEFVENDVVLPDQIKWEKGKPVARSKTVTVSRPGNEFAQKRLSEARYAMFHPSQSFSLTSNLIPFMGNTSGNRASYATHHIEQAISLADREQPLVQVGTGSSKEGSRSFEELIGRQSGHMSPVNGTVKKVDGKSVHVEGADGQIRKIQLYNNFPLNDSKSVLNSTPIVQVGQAVKAGQPVADTNFTKNGTLALGKNLNVAYIPYKGYNFEDGVVISESAARELRSEHMHKPSVKVLEGDKTTKKAFETFNLGAFTKEQLGKVNENGRVRVGQRVNPGDPLVLSSRMVDIQGGIAKVRKSLSGQHNDASLRWDSEHAGEVVALHENKKGEITVHVRTIEPMQVGDKLTGRYGNKGIVTKVVPDEEMPRTANGRVVQVALNPSGVPGRMNVGQVLETALSKVAEKTGKPLVIDNFEFGVDQVERAKKMLKEHGLEDQEELIDPKTGQSLGKALVGKQHLLKLQHQVDKKVSVRSGMTLKGETSETYDINLQPTSGGKQGGQSLGNLGINVLLAHGAKANIREIQTFKSQGPDSMAPEGRKFPSQHHEVWNAIQLGEPLPTPQPTFSFDKFTSMLKASGINVEKKGNKLQLSPLTDKEVLAMSSGELRKPSMLTHAKLGKDGMLKPYPGGLFDENITGGLGGKKWSHIKLAEPMPNPVYEGAIQKVLGLSASKFNAVVNGEAALNEKNEVVPLGKGATGGPAIASALARIDVNAELQKAKQQLQDAKAPESIAHGGNVQQLDLALKKVKYLGLLAEKGMKADDAYVINNLPVLPPAMRTPSVLADGNVRWEDVNGLYKNFAENNGEYGKLAARKAEGIGDEALKEHRASAYDGLCALMGVGNTKAEKDVKARGYLHIISPQGSVKTGFFQKTLMSRRQDMSMRSTIVPEPEMGIDEVGLPVDKTVKLFRPFVVKKMVDLGIAQHPLEAQELLSDTKAAMKNKGVRMALDKVLEDRPVLLKRDPALHLHSIQAFKVRPTVGSAIKIHPLLVSGYNADFDGDAMSAYVPMSDEAVEEARGMMPSKNLFNVATGRVAHVPTLESALGLYRMSEVEGRGKRKFGSEAEAIKAVQKGQTKINELVDIKGVGKTTAGRVLIAEALPKAMRSEVLKNYDMRLDGKGISDIYGKLAKEHKDDFADSANRLKDLGFDASFGQIRLKHPVKHGGPGAIAAAENRLGMEVVSIGTHSLGLDDLTPDKQVRDSVIAATQKVVDRINQEQDAPDRKERRVVAEWEKATKKMKELHKERIKDHPDNLAKMLNAGVKPKWSQYQQLKLAPMLLEDASGRTIPTPVTKSYSEGLDMAGYWIQSSGARKGSIQKVQEVRDPGYFSKQLINTSMNLVVTGDDCGTSRGIGLGVDSDDVNDRELAADFKVKGMVLKKGTVLTPDVVGQLRALDKNAQVVVRSTLKCEHGEGLCRKCAGLGPDGQYHDLGTNVGILGAQSLGERAVQLALKAFHSGGVKATGGKGTLGAFQRTQQLTLMPKNPPDSAVLAMKSGVIEKVEDTNTGTNVWVAGQRHFVARDRSGVPLAQATSPTVGWSPPQPGMVVEAGQQLSDPSRTFIDPHRLYKATNNIEKVQNFLTKELHDIYAPEGVRRQHVETVVKAMSNVTRVRNPGDGDVLKGDFQPTSKVRAMNAKLVKQGKRPIVHAPVLKGIDVAPRVLHDDWMAKLNYNRLTQTLTEAAATGSVSDLHGLHPVPGVAYGAEFGMTQKHRLRAPHLRDVPDWRY